MFRLVCKGCGLKHLPFTSSCPRCGGGYTLQRVINANQE